MKTTVAMSHVLDFSIEERTLIDDIKEWIDSNMMYGDQNHVWNIGITTNLNIFKVAGQVRGNFECKHFKHWNADSFENAIRIITRLNRYPFIFKSQFNEYIGKGKYVFIYKAPCASKSLFYHTLNS